MTITIPLTKGKVAIIDDEDDAAIAYNEAAREWFGDFARLNIIT